MTTKNDNLATRLAALSKRSTKELRAAYEKQHGRPANGFSRNALIKTLATAPAPNATEPKQAKVAAPKEPKATEPKPEKQRRTGARDPRLPAAGTVLERTYKGKVHKVTVLRDGFGYEAETYTSLTAVAKKATGYASISGTLFFGIAKPAAAKAPTAKPATRKATKG